MKRKFLLMCLALLPIGAPALAKEGKDCAAESAKLPHAERSAHTKKCLDELGDPSNVRQTQQQRKQSQCEQNAANRKLQGSEKSSYLSSCMNSNDAAEAAKATPAQTSASTPAAKPAKTSARSSKPANSCVKQANQKGLKGKERKQFLKECKPE
jgi:hypothetical protein